MSDLKVMLFNMDDSHTAERTGSMVQRRVITNSSLC